jgi:hypothetical protein
MTLAPFCGVWPKLQIYLPTFEKKVDHHPMQMFHDHIWRQFENS